MALYNTEPVVAKRRYSVSQAASFTTKCFDMHGLIHSLMFNLPNLYSYNQ